MKIERFMLARNGWVPNNDRLPVTVCRAALAGKGEALAAQFEALFAEHGCPPGWRDGIYDYHHYHSTAHEALGAFAGRRGWSWADQIGSWSRPRRVTR
jgi:uncharacterized protein YjlB